MSDALKHIIVADLIGERVAHAPGGPIAKAVTPFALGAASHLAMDRIDPDFTINWFNPDALRAALPYIGIEAVLIGLTLYLVWRKSRGKMATLRSRLFGIFGGLAPDLVDGVYSVLHPQTWYAGQLLVPGHRSPLYMMPMWSTLVISGALMFARFGLHRALRWIHLRPSRT